MRHFKFLLFLLLTTSCQFFETEKISTETFYKEELKAINWKDVDQYPAFLNCENSEDKTAQKTCFETTLSSYLYAAINKKGLVTSHHFNDTVQLDVAISKEGKLSVKNIKMDSLVATSLPSLKDWMLQGIDSLQIVAPAYKRGIPVKTEFSLPIIIKTQ